MSILNFVRNAEIGVYREPLMRFPKTPAIIKPFARDLVWNISTPHKVVYITFDDGPTPGVTDKILDILSKYNATATFFCVGNQVEKYPELFQRIIDEGHVVGNHSYSHLNGWKTPKQDYLDDVSKAQLLINSNLFRPPYGKATFSQVKQLKKHYKIIMWDVLSYDYDSTIGVDKCYHNVVNNVDNGSIIVLHDSEKAKNNVLNVLPRLLLNFQEKGIRSEKIKLT